MEICPECSKLLTPANPPITAGCATGTPSPTREGEPGDDPNRKGKCGDGNSAEGVQTLIPGPISIDDPSKECLAGRVPASLDRDSSDQ